jgi:hypothetical protein
LGATCAGGWSNLLFGHPHHDVKARSKLIDCISFGDKFIGLIIVKRIIDGNRANGGGKVK